MPIYQKEIAVPALNGKSASFALSAAPRGERAEKGVLYPRESRNVRAAGEGICSVRSPRRLFDAAAFGAAVSGVYFLRTESGGRVLFFSDGGLHVCTYTAADGSLSAPVSAGDAVFAAPPRGIGFVDAQGAPALFLCAPEGCFVWKGESLSAATDAPAAVCGCTHYERLFLVSAAKGFRVHFSAPLSEPSFDAAYPSAGYVDLSPEYGGVSEILSCGDRLCLLRERGLTFLQAEGESVAFSAVSRPASFGSVFRGSAQAAGESVLFLAEDGLYVCQKTGDVRRIAAPWLSAAPPAPAPDCVSGVCGRQYFLSYTAAGGDRRTLVYDLLSEEGYLCSFAADAPVYGERKDLFLCADGVYAFAPSDRAPSLSGVWESEETLLGLGAGRKLLRRLTLFGRGRLQLTIEGEHARDKRVYDMELDGQASVFPLLRGHGFLLRIRGGADGFFVHGLQAEGAALKGV